MQFRTVVPWVIGLFLASFVVVPDFIEVASARVTSAQHIQLDEAVYAREARAVIALNEFRQYPPPRECDVWVRAETGQKQVPMLMIGHLRGDPASVLQVSAPAGDWTRFKALADAIFSWWGKEPAAPGVGSVQDRGAVWSGSVGALVCAYPLKDEALEHSALLYAIGQYRARFNGRITIELRCANIPTWMLRGYPADFTDIMVEPPETKK